MRSTHTRALHHRPHELAGVRGRASRSGSRVAAAGGDKATLSPRCSFLVLFQQRLIDVDLDTYYDRCLERRGEKETRERTSTWHCEADGVERGILRRVMHVMGAGI
jgi:hypothetical protein